MGVFEWALRKKEIFSGIDEKECMASDRMANFSEEDLPRIPV
jgi:hypothetical protein